MKEPKLPVNVDQQLSELTRYKVQSEIISLQRQLERISVDTNTVDFALLETFKEMIHSRRQLLSSLRPSV